MLPKEHGLREVDFYFWCKTDAIKGTNFRILPISLTSVPALQGFVTPSRPLKEDRFNWIPQKWCISRLYVAHLSREGLAVEQVLGAPTVLCAKVKPDLFQPVAVAQRPARDVHQVWLVWAQGHMSARVIHRSTDLKNNLCCKQAVNKTLLEYVLQE